MSVKVFGIEITIQDHAAILTPDADIGLYNRTSVLASNAAADQKDVVVASGATFRAGDKVLIKDGAASEINVIASIASNTLTMYTDLAHAYTTAASAHVDANSVFRWLQNAAAGVTGWIAEFIVEDGIEKYSRGADYRDGGAVSNPGACGVTVKNTDKFWKDLVDLGLTLNGMEFRLYEFLDAVQTLKWRGYVSETSWDAAEYVIAAETGDRNRRNTALAKQVNEEEYPYSGNLGDINVPLSVGKFLPSSDVNNNVIYNSYAKGIRTAKSGNLFNTNQLPSAEPAGGLSAFLVYSGSGLSYALYIATNLIDYTGIGALIEGKYLHVISGKSDGSFRKIASFVSVDSTIPGKITVTIDKYFEEDLDTDTWVEIIDIQNEWALDSSPCKAFIDESGAELAGNAEIFSYDDGLKKYDKIGNLLTSVGADKNKLTARPEHFLSDLDNIDTFITLPLKAVQLLDDPYVRYGWGGYLKKGEGVFTAGFADAQVSSHAITGSLDDLIDRDGDGVTSFFQQYFNFTCTPGAGTSYLVIGFMADLPDLQNTDFDKAYLLIKATCNLDKKALFHLGLADTVFGISVHAQPYFGAVVDQYSRSSSMYGATTDYDYYAKNFPDEYFETNKPSTGNQFFYKLTASEKSTEATLTGYARIPLATLADPKLKNIIQKLLFNFNFQRTYNTGAQQDFDVTLKLEEVALCLAKSGDIGGEVYSPFKGRIFNDTWAARKTAANLMESPIDFMEHACRLQNWSENSPVPTNGWGYGYAAGALIKTSGLGSFDAASLQSLAGLHLAEQILDYDKSYTDKLKAAICRSFFLGSYVDENGYECVRLLDANATAEYTVALTDIKDRKKIKITPPPADSIYPAPFVKYQKDYASGEYQKIIRFKNVDAATFSETYVEAPAGLFAGDEAEYYWGLCKILWNKTRQANEPPEDVTDLDFCNGTDADQAAKDYICKLIEWMGAYEIEFPVHYEKGSGWKEGTVLTISLPHQTNAANITCLVEEVTVDVNPPYEVSVRALMWLEGITAEYFIQNVMGVFGDDNDWQNTPDQSGAIEDIQNVT